MENLMLFLIGFPFVSALLLAIFKNDNARKAVTYLSSAVIIFSALTFAVVYFAENSVFSLNSTLEASTILGISAISLIDIVMIAVEVFLVLLITVLSFKYKKYYAAVLSIAQTALMFWYEFSGNEPEMSENHFYVDQLTVVMVLIIAIVGTLITVYACGYMNDYHQHHRKDVKDRRCYFFAMMYIFLGAMFGLVLSNNIIWIYFFWEITSVCSFLLIGYTKTEEAITNCFRALWMNLLGGCGFAIAIVWLGIKFNTTSLQNLITMDGKTVLVPVLFLGFAALTKSAQLPFSKWLLGAMVAPTPSSALLHSATMVKAGVYLLIRLAPVMSNQLSGYMIAVIGGYTFLVMSMFAISTSDGKRVLAFSTLSNLGLITACAGVGTQEAVWAGILLVIFHAVSKSLLFQTVGSIEHQTGSRDIDSMHGMVRRYPNLTWTLVVGITGMFLAPFGMLVSKWAALKSFVDNGSVLLVLFICFGSSTTLVYWAKWLATVLASDPTDKHQENTISKNQWFSLTVHSVIMIALCFSFPVISSKVILPYLRDVFGNQSVTLLSNDNIIVMLLMIILIFVVPFVVYLLIRKVPIKKSTRYFNGGGTEDQVGFVDSFGEEKKMVLSNWYMEDLFGEKRWFKPSVIISALAIAVIIIASVVGGV